MLVAHATVTFTKIFMPLARPSVDNSTLTMPLRTMNGSWDYGHGTGSTMLVDGHDWGARQGTVGQVMGWDASHGVGGHGGQWDGGPRQ